MVPHLFAEDERTGQVVVIVFQRFLNTFANCLECSKVNDRIDVRVFIEYLFNTLFIQQIDLIESEILAGDFADFVEDLGLGVEKLSIMTTSSPAPSSSTQV